MKKFIMVIVCLMTMVVFSSCGSASKEEKIEKFNLYTDNITLDNQGIVDETLKLVEGFYYLHGKYEPSEVHYLKTKFHIITDSLAVVEMYVRGKNSFDGGTVSNEIFIYLKRDGDYYFNRVHDREMANLQIRLEICDTSSEKNKIFSRVALNGYKNNETDWECVKRLSFKSKKDWKNKNYRKFAIEYTEKELGIEKIK